MKLVHRGLSVDEHGEVMVTLEMVSGRGDAVIWDTDAGPVTDAVTRDQYGIDKIRLWDRRVAEFEQFVHAQKPAEKPWTPVTDYSFEARKAIEGVHPQLIKDVFQPQSVLNVGCATGFLDGQLRDGTIRVEGIDLNPPDGPHFWKQDICDETPIVEWHVPYIEYDLVICRELLEHLTLLQIKRAVHNLVKLSSKFIYVTTRFCKSPQHLLSVDASDDLDPDHRTMLTKSFLRTLFVLEGCKSRPDLEQQMDWQRKGRVLVFEVPA